MRPWQFLYTAPSEGWKFATWVFFFSWSMATLIPIFLIRGEQPLQSWILWWLAANWAIASTFVFALFTNLTRLVDRVQKLEEAGAASRQPS
jgi:hypothetical protein